MDGVICTLTAIKTESKGMVRGWESVDAEVYWMGAMNRVGRMSMAADEVVE